MKNAILLSALAIGPAVPSLAAAQTTAAPADAPASLAPGPGRVVLHLTTGGGSEMVLLRTGTRGPLSFACRTPCTLYVRPGLTAVALLGGARRDFVFNVPATGTGVFVRAAVPPSGSDARAAARPGDQGSTAAAAFGLTAGLAITGAVVIGAVLVTALAAVATLGGALFPSGGGR